ncbi:MAG: hypothetical protein A2W36_02690 [Chloroflexi bacterium RBG_16_58_14]|nr:MAG: hypothetical protein A2W36_02690 [Chloroflexi bacterium RBG_16_58_14]
MNNKQTPPVNAFLPAALFLAIIGWGGLVALIFFTMPTVGPRWLFFFLSVLAVTGITLPLFAFLNNRFPSTPPVSTGVILRQALWAGIYFPTLAWLQIGRVLTSSLGLLLAVGFILIEFLLRLREKSQWKP